MEVRPGNRAVVHHANIYIRRTGIEWLGSIRWAFPSLPTEQRPAYSQLGLIDGNVAGYTPGKQTVVLAADQAADPCEIRLLYSKCITANGKDGRDRTKLGLIFSKTLPAERVAA
jgi:hypothetical protein